MKSIKRVALAILFFIIGVFVIGSIAALIYDEFIRGLKYEPGDRDKKYDMGGLDYFLGGGAIGGIVAVIIVVRYWRKKDRLKIS
jgi:membrane protease YdiL (CAAX protease family)